MMTISNKLLSILLVATFILVAGRAQATMIHDLQITPIYGSFNGTGRIEFNTLSGTHASGVNAFSFSGTGPLGSFTFTASDILNIAWTINASDMLTLNLGTFLDQPLTAGNTSSCIILQNNNAGGTCGPGVLTTSVSMSRIAQQIIGGTWTGGGTLTTTPVYQQVSEPSLFALLAIGLIGLRRARRRNLIFTANIAHSPTP